MVYMCMCKKNIVYIGCRYGQLLVLIYIVSLFHSAIYQYIFITNT